MKLTRLGTAVLIGTLLASSSVAADPEPMPTTHLWMRSGDGLLHTTSGHDYVIPKDSHILNPEGYGLIDLEFKRLQDAETRLGAENKSLRSSADSFPWVSTLVGVGIGLVAGTYLWFKIN